MKTFLTLTLLLSVSISHADFVDAQKSYEQGNYTEAFLEYKKLAKLGNTKSQYNIAVMLSKGQGTEKDIIKAYAWVKLANNKKYEPLIKFLESQLSQKELAQSTSFYNKIKEQYAYEKSKVLLGPILNSNDNTDNTSQNIKIVIDKQFPPTYPSRMASSGIQGWVKLTSNIYPDHSIRDIQVVESFPNNGFNKEAIKSIEKMKVHFEKNGSKVKIDEPFAISQIINFKLSGASSELSMKQKEYLTRLENKAENGDIVSQYKYAAIQDRYFLEKDIDLKKMNKWLFNASQEGIVDAQYRLGKNIYYGKDCKVEKQKGLDWIMHAAQHGNPYAQYMAYQMLQNKTVINQSGESPFYWLQQAAKNGSSIAQLNYAKEIATKSNPSTIELELAKSYINNYAKETYKTIQWYQISALIDDKSKRHSKALSKIKSALKLAKKYDWDLTELESQKIMIKKHKKNKV